MTLVREILLKRHVNSGYPTQDDFEEKQSEIDIDSVKLEENQVLLSLEIASPDPYMRGRMSTHKSYIPPYEINKPIVGYSIAKVVKSNNSKWLVGDHLMGVLPWITLFVFDGNYAGMNKINPNLAPIESYVGLLGMPGLTAYHGLNEIAEPKQGETVVISGAAGAVGQYVGQICKIKGCKVIGITGSDDKIKYIVNELGFDAGVNYNSPSYKEDLKNATNGKVDIYWENVGGDVSDAVWPLLNFGARIPVCGLISAYNKSEQDVGPRFLQYILKSSSKIQGFIVSNYSKKNPEALKQLGEWYASGLIKDKFTINKGFDQLIPSFIGLFKGLNTGKMIVKIE